jgi:chaperone BCS1
MISEVPLLSSLEALTHKNPVLSTLFGLWGVGLLTFVTKDVPGYLYRKVTSLLFVQIQVPSSEGDFYLIVKWLEDQGHASRARKIRITQSEITPGLGTHYFFHHGRPFKVRREKEEPKPMSDRSREELALSTWGRSQAPIRNLIKSIRDSDRNKDTVINQWNDGCWSRLCEQPKRTFETLYLPKATHKTLKCQVSRFLENRDWYFKHGIPYRMGICLHGPPGTGKTSIAKAICAEFDMRLYIMSLSSVNDQSFQTALADTEKKSLILIEDIDCFSLTHTRGSEGQKSVKPFREEALSLSGLLNGIDGAANSEATLFVFTTNHLEKLDPALLRPGRIDLSLEVGYHTEETIWQAFRAFFPHYLLPADVRFRTDITPAFLQGEILKNIERPDLVQSAISAEDCVAKDASTVLDYATS